MALTRQGTLADVALAQTADPSEVGFDAARLSRMDAHFARYVDMGRLAGWQLVVTRAGQVVKASTYGLADREAGRAVKDDTLWRIYSMTKPVTSVAAMMLWEEGHFELTDEISRWLPEFADVKVYDKGSALRPYVVPAIEPIRVWHLLTHTSGLTYGFLQTSPVDAIYRANGWDLAPRDGVDLAAACRTFAQFPLLYQPGTRWGYSVATDVLGRLVEVIAGQSLEEFCQRRIFDPLGMGDTVWSVDAERSERLAALYAPTKEGGLVRFDAMGRHAHERPALFAGGAGLVSSAADYHRFTQLLLHEGQLDGARLLGRQTVRFMTRNHLPGNQDLGALSTGGFAETTFEGVEFGLGFAIVRDPVPTRTPGSVGSYYWGGAASTFFWIDPAEELTAMMYAQLMPSSTYPLRPQLRQLLYAALS